MKKIIAVGFGVILNTSLGAFPVINKTPHDMYLTVKSVQTGAFITKSNQGNYALLRANKTKQISVPGGMNPLDYVIAEAFFTSNLGACYHVMSNGIYQIKDFNAGGLVIKVSGSNPSPTPQLLLKAQIPMWCDVAYMDADSAATSMPPRKPK